MTLAEATEILKEVLEKNGGVYKELGDLTTEELEAIAKEEK